MTARLTREELRRLVREHMRAGFIRLNPALTVAQALDLIFEKQPEGRII